MSSSFTEIPTTYADSIIHYLYIRPHKAQSKSTTGPQWPENRTLFVTNLPPDATEREVIVFFKRYGFVERVVFDSDGAPPDDPTLVDQDDDSGSDSETPQVEHSSEPPTKRKKKGKTPKSTPVISLPPPPEPLRRLRPTGRTAHIIFVDPISAFPTSTKPLPWSHNNSESPTGLRHYTSLYSALRPPLDAVKSHVDSFMVNYTESLTKLPSSKYKKGEAIVDEDGFTLVTRGGAYGQTVGGGASVANKKFELGMDVDETGTIRKKRKQQRKKEDLQEFYAFKKAEKQRQELLDLKSRFEQDQALIEKKRATRKFKPY